MEYLLKKAKVNKWEIQNNCKGGKIVFVPYDKSIKVIEHLRKINAKFSNYCNWDYNLNCISIW